MLGREKQEEPTTGKPQAAIQSAVGGQKGENCL